MLNEMQRGDHRDTGKEKKELSPRLLKLIALTFVEFPELSTTKVEVFDPKDEFDGGGYYDFVNDADGNPIPQISISNAEAQPLAPLLKNRALSIAMNAELLGISVEEFTPELLNMFIIAHELGHINDYVVNYKDNPDISEGWDAVDDMTYERDAVLGMLPIANKSPNVLTRTLEHITTVDEVATLFPKITSHPKFSEFKTVQDILDTQEREYRLSPQEAYADQFAANFLKKHASELDIPQLLGKSTELDAQPVAA